jgi:hypothetical protein
MQAGLQQTQQHQQDQSPVSGSRRSGAQQAPAGSPGFEPGVSGDETDGCEPPAADELVISDSDPEHGAAFTAGQLQQAEPSTAAFKAQQVPPCPASAQQQQDAAMGRSSLGQPASQPKRLLQISRPSNRASEPLKLPPGGEHCVTSRRRRGGVREWSDDDSGSDGCPTPQGECCLSGLRNLLCTVMALNGPKHCC